MKNKRYRVKDFALLCGVDQRTVYRWIKAKKLIGLETDKNGILVIPDNKYNSYYKRQL